MSPITVHLREEWVPNSIINYPRKYKNSTFILIPTLVTHGDLSVSTTNRRMSRSLSESSWFGLSGVTWSKGSPNCLPIRLLPVAGRYSFFHGLSFSRFFISGTSTLMNVCIHSTDLTLQRYLTTLHKLIKNISSILLNCTPFRIRPLRCSGNLFFPTATLARRDVGYIFRNLHDPSAKCQSSIFWILYRGLQGVSEVGPVATLN